MRPLGVCSGFALRPVGVCSGSGPRLDPESEPEVRFGSAFCMVGSGGYCISLVVELEAYNQMEKRDKEFKDIFEQLPQRSNPRQVIQLVITD